MAALGSDMSLCFVFQDDIPTPAGSSAVWNDVGAEIVRSDRNSQHLPGLVLSAALLHQVSYLC